MTTFSITGLNRDEMDAILEALDIYTRDLKAKAREYIASPEAAQMYEMYEEIGNAAYAKVEAGFLNPDDGSPDAPSYD